MNYPQYPLLSGALIHVHVYQNEILTKGYLFVVPETKVEETTLSIDNLLFDLPEEADDSNLVNFNLTQPFDPMFSTIFEEQLGTDEFGYESQYQQAETACTSVPSDNDNNMLDRKQFSCTSQVNDIQPSISTVESTIKEPAEKADSDLDDEKLDKIQSDVKPKSTVNSEIWALNRFHGNPSFK